VVKRKSYRLLRLVCLTRSSSYLACSTPRETTIQRLVAECKEILVSVGKILDSMIVKYPKPKPEVDVEPEPWPEVIAELVSLQEEISSRPIEVEELPIETLVDLPAQPVMELVPSLAAMRASLSLRSSDEYDSLQIFQQETVSQGIGTLICGLDFREAELTCYDACFFFELPSTAADLSRELVSPPPS